MSADLPNATELLHVLRERVVQRTRTCQEISEADVWGHHGTVVWHAHKFVGRPTFYPIYRSGDHYSYSILALILKKGYLAVNRSVLTQAARDDFVHGLSEETIDREIRRIGGPVRARPRITDSSEYARLLARAATEDVEACERRHPGFTNVLLCGGKDSLNLTLLPWKNETLVASAPPNYELVARFLEANDLGIPLIRLDDPAEPDVLRHEALENACQKDLRFCRWGAHLRALARELGQRVVFWKGQLFDVVSTPRWRSYRHPGGRRRAKLRRQYRETIAPRLPVYAQRLMWRRWLDPALRRSLWRRGALRQGTHMSFLREITDSLVLSGYHGPAVSEVVRHADLWSAVNHDVRPEIGLALRGYEVRYPAENPSAPRSAHRQGLHHPDRFLALLRSGGVKVID